MTVGDINYKNLDEATDADIAAAYTAATKLPPGAEIVPYSWEAFRLADEIFRRSLNRTGGGE